MTDKAKKRIMGFVYFVSSIIFVGCHEVNKAVHDKPTNQKFLSINLSSQAEYQPLLTGTPQTCGMRAGRVYLKPGQECGSHSTEAHEEMLTFLDGKGVALIGEEKAANDVGKGNIVYIPPHTTHNIKNTGTEPLVYIYCVAPVK